MSGGGSSTGKGSGSGRGKGGKKGLPTVWDDSLGPEYFREPVYEFPKESKCEFNKQNPLRGYDNKKEVWPKCMHGEDCLVQVITNHPQGGRRFFKCPRAWASDAPENCGFVRWIDPPPLYPYEEYIAYLHNRIFDLETEVARPDKEDEEYNNDNVEPLCTDPYCNCTCHKKGPPSPPPPPPPPPPTMGGYYGEGSTQFAMWNNY
ncbi:unnamed protein product [Urochloa humidicola]